MVSQAFWYALKQNMLVSLLAFIALAVVILLDVVFFDVTELFPGGAELADIISNLSMSVVAGYIFYIMTSVKLEADRINKSKEIAKKIVGSVRNQTVLMFRVLAEQPHEKFTTFPSEDELSGYLNNKTFVTKVKGTRYIDGNGVVHERDLHFYLFNDFPPKALHLQSSLSAYLDFLDQDMQVAFYKHFNSNFFDNFADPTVAIVLNGRSNNISDFTNCFFVLRQTTLDLVESYERVYGTLEK
ncbi:hypothetical protein AB4283_17165 [Vibrio splendidus]|uniref:Uncharacterized protein n=1 Tax=Vibrio atlanticus TaxID=693153 RepID=A0A1C3IKC0_9VIBR|nr:MULTISPECIES: hypothetical protein [Vibrio]KLN66068.1 hypothetical protein ZX61_06715 [Vibrio sp. VPAP30]MBE8564720.1 hypothetical protein [Vibrio sp. OPT20]PMG63970.1 hypothetical protein BCU88_05255 [Vibrio splendidus]PMO46245.1 hypothetical protein BCT10_09030 [Vibrio splendidus]PTP39671.1 hypothetical protein CWN83_24755 [Vibrio splendidus]